MIPGSAISISSESISQAFPRGDRALLYSRDTIIPWRLLLKKPMPVEGGAFLGAGNVITDLDIEGVTPVAFNGRCWKSPVDEQGTSVHTIRGNKATSYVEVVIASDAY